MTKLEKVSYTGWSACFLSALKVSAEMLVEATHQICPCPNATRGNIEVKLNVLTSAVATSAGH